jgi:hypothetical protein
MHRESLAEASAQRQALAVQETEKLMILMDQNTQLTEMIKNLSQRIEAMTTEMHKKVILD